MSHQQAIAELLSNIGTDRHAFATKITLDLDPQIEVEGVGPIALPITARTAHRLCAQAEPACHGYKDQTRLDLRVRDTWEISGSSVRLQAPDWPGVLDETLGRIRHDLGMPSTGQLTAELDKLLIYGPGQFFVTHQDTEKADGMLATLTITLPSDFSGGEFRVAHQKQMLRSRGSRKKLSLVAFYADCLHEARPVTEGYRVVLTYNLVLLGTRPPESMPTHGAQALANALQQYWNTPLPSRWRHEPERPAPDRLVFLLDHQYTQRSLSWERLKGADHARALALREAARLLNAQTALAQAEIHETWSVEYDADSFQKSYRQRSEGRRAESDMQLQDLIDHEIELRHWCGYEDEPPQPAISRVSNDELCCVRPTVDFDPYESEYQGYMGNYGDTMDRWYHRAALVIWPSNRRFIMQARQAPLWGLQEIHRELQSGQSEQALLHIQALIPHWKPSILRAHDLGKPLLSATLPAAIGIQDPALAFALLEPFTLEDLAADAVADFLSLIPSYGLAWSLQCLQDRQVFRRDPDWVTSTLPALVQGAKDSQEATSLVKRIVETYWHSLDQSLQQIRNTAGQTRSARMMQELTPALLVLLDATCVLRNPQQEQAMHESLQAGNHPLPFLMSVLHAAEGTTVWPRLSSLREHCVRLLMRNLDTPARSHDDWSIPAPGDFSAAAEPIFKEFLQCPRQQTLTWPLAKAGRDSIQEWIRHHDLPIQCSVLKTGSPHKLLLEKTQALFTRATKQRQRMTAELAWLQARAD